MNPDLLKKILAAIEAGEDKSGLLAEIVAQAAGGAPAPEATSDALSDTAVTPPAEELAALRKQIEALSKGQSAEIVELRATVTALTSERDQKDQTERVALVGELVKLGRETPATAWDGEAEKQKPRKRLQDEPIAELRERVALYRAAGPVGNATPPKSEPVVVVLSKDEQAYCTKHGLTPEQFQAKKAGAVKKATK